MCWLHMNSNYECMDKINLIWLIEKWTSTHYYEYIDRSKVVNPSINIVHTYEITIKVHGSQTV